MRSELTSFSISLWRARSISATTDWIFSVGTGRFSQARTWPPWTFSRSRALGEPSRLTTTSGVFSTYSKVVKRSPQPSHSRRRRIEDSSEVRRELTTRFCRLPHLGHFMSDESADALDEG